MFAANRALTHPSRAANAKIIMKYRLILLGLGAARSKLFQSGVRPRSRF